jgi:hypothetical protein
MSNCRFSEWRNGVQIGRIEIPKNVRAANAKITLKDTSTTANGAHPLCRCDW